MKGADIRPYSWPLFAAKLRRTKELRRRDPFCGRFPHYVLWNSGLLPGDDKRRFGMTVLETKEMEKLYGGNGTGGAGNPADPPKPPPP